jgi:hypothetical protein
MMSIQLSWYLENHVMLLVSHGESSDQDMFEVDQPIIDYLTQSQAPLVHLIINNLESSFTPSAKALPRLKFPKHPRCGWVILVGPTNTFQRFVGAVATGLFKARQRMFDTMDEALVFLNDMDSTLPPPRDTKLDKAS